MRNTMSCPFCNPDYIMKTVRFDEKDHSCNRWIYKSPHCYAVLKPEQHTVGDSLVILRKQEQKEHKKDITDFFADGELEQLHDFIEAINRVSERIKNFAVNEKDECPERIYVGMLGDGIKHLHAHLLPRYPFRDKEKATYEEYFRERDGQTEIDRKKDELDLGGYWYVFERERTIHKSEFGLKTTQEKISILQQLADRLRF